MKNASAVVCFLLQSNRILKDFLRRISVLTRKEFCQGCLALVLAGAGMPLLFGRQEDELKKTEENKEEKKLIGFCGITCSECPAFIATQKNDDALRVETAKKWSEMYNSDIKTADINCSGCLAESGLLFNYCNVCEIRKCALEKKVTSCAACPEYSCKKLDSFLAQVPEARKTLEELRRQK